MKRQGRLIPQLDTLEDRTCPAVVGIDPSGMLASVDPVSLADPAVVASVEPEAMNSPNDLIRMAMIMKDMMSMYNEYDQSPGAKMGSAIRQKPDSPGNGMAEMPASSSLASDSKGASQMPPAQMMMQQAPLVSPGWSASPKMATMPVMKESDSGSGGEDEKSRAETMPVMPEDQGGMSGKDRPPVLSPGELELPVAPELSPGAIEPGLERAIPGD
ncbi:hypothetical protein GC170_19275 [bacterium]|nr:hypothetical protein [bacterium]